MRVAATAVGYSVMETGMNRTVVIAGGLTLTLLGAGVTVLFLPPSEPKHLDDCAMVLGQANKVNCITAVAIEQFRTDPSAGIALTEAHLPEQLNRDFVYLQVTTTIDAKSTVYCQRIVDTTFQKACFERVKRPHLDGQGSAPRPAGPSKEGGPQPRGPMNPQEHAPPSGAIP